MITLRRLGLPLLLATIGSTGPVLAAENETIVVTARSMKDTADDLAACLARKCPPDEDVKATLAHAENQFVAGDYKSARSTLLKSVGRNRGAAKSYPLPVSNLMRANARVAVNLGERESYQMSTIAIRDALKEGLPSDDLRVVAATIEVADMRARLGYREEASRIYRDAMTRAEAKGDVRLATIAKLRQILVLMQSGEPEDIKDGRKQLIELQKGTDPRYETARMVAGVMVARLDRKKGDTGATDALIAAYKQKGGTDRPTLLAYDPIKQPQQAAVGSGGNPLSQTATKNFDGRWVDIGFWISPDGKTSDIEVIRQAGKDVSWAKPVLTSVGTRVYAPLNREPGDPGVYAVERYTMTSFWEERTGTHFRERSKFMRIEQTDLTSEADAAPPPKAS
jgi:hypothetical protein